jgi:hypothetical protein
MDMSAKFITENPLKNIQMNYNHKVEKSTQSHFDLFVAGRNWLVNIHQNCNLGRFTP